MTKNILDALWAKIKDKFVAKNSVPTFEGVYIKAKGSGTGMVALECTQSGSGLREVYISNLKSNYLQMMGSGSIDIPGNGGISLGSGTIQMVAGSISGVGHINMSGVGGISNVQSMTFKSSGTLGGFYYLRFATGMAAGYNRLDMQSGNISEVASIVGMTGSTIYNMTLSGDVTPSTGFLGKVTTGIASGFLNSGSIDNLLTKLGEKLGGTWSKTWNTGTNSYDFSVTTGE